MSLENQAIAHSRAGDLPREITLVCTPAIENLTSGTIFQLLLVKTALKSMIYLPLVR